MNKTEFKKSKQLGMSSGRAYHLLKKMILLKLIQKLRLDSCFRCGLKIQSPDQLSIDHKEFWMDVDVKFFWDLDNISFSHSKCNSRFSRRTQKGTGKHPSQWAYRNGCKCDECREMAVKRIKEQRTRGIGRIQKGVPE